MKQLSIKISLIITIILVSINYFSAVQAEIFPNDFPNENAKLISIHNRTFSPGGRYHLLVPLNKTKYPLINKNPIAFFFFVSNWDDKRIKNLSVEDLIKSEDFLEKYAIAWKHIDGFNTEYLKGNKFDLAKKKKIIISQLLDCYSKYRKEYELYLKDTFVFFNRTSLNKSSKYYNIFSFNKVDDNTKNKITIHSNLSRFSCNHNYKLDSYNVDTQQLDVMLFGADDSDDDHVGWEDDYISSLKEQIYIQTKRRDYVKRRLNIPMPIDIAEKLFSSNNRALEYTVITVKPKNGWLKRKDGRGGSQLRGNLWGATVNFDIICIVKYFYHKNEDLMVFDYKYIIQPTDTQFSFQPSNQFSKDDCLDLSLINVSNNNKYIQNQKPFSNNDLLGTYRIKMMVTYDNDPTRVTDDGAMFIKSINSNGTILGSIVTNEYIYDLDEEFKEWENGYSKIYDMKVNFNTGYLSYKQRKMWKDNTKEDLGHFIGQISKDNESKKIQISAQYVCYDKWKNDIGCKTIKYEFFATKSQ